MKSHPIFAGHAYPEQRCHERKPRTYRRRGLMALFATKWGANLSSWNLVRAVFFRVHLDCTATKLGICAQK